MGKKKKASKTLGLDIGLILFQYFLKTEYLHLGYWTDDLEVKMENLARAQQNYADLIAGHIPAGTRRILEVGCGSGRFASHLIDLGFQVECVAPDSYLTDYAARRLGERCRVTKCLFEDFQGHGEYDLILFSESFQYIPIESGLRKSCELLKEDGHILICDFFKTATQARMFVRGGHQLENFYKAVTLHPLKKVEEIDITRETAPNLLIVDDIALNLIRPLWELILYYLEHNNHRVLSKTARWLLRKKIDRINRIFEDKRQGDFAAHQSYRLFLYRKAV